MIKKPGYKTSEFWFTVVSFIFSGLYLLGIIGENEQKDELISVVSHAVESCILIGGQLVILYRYMKGRTEEKIELEKHIRHLPENDLENDEGVSNNIDKRDTPIKSPKKKKKTTRKTNDKSRNKNTNSKRSRKPSSTNKKQPGKRTKTSGGGSVENSSNS